MNVYNQNNRTNLLLQNMKRHHSTTPIKLTCMKEDVLKEWTCLFRLSAPHAHQERRCENGAAVVMINYV